MTDMNVFRVAGFSALFAIPALLLSGIFLALFFGGAGAQYGPLNDFFVAVALGLLILPARALPRLAGELGSRWFVVLSWLAIAGLAEAAAGQLLLVAGVISLETSFATGTLGILPVIAWGAAQVYLGLRFGAPSRAVAWTIAAVFVFALLLTITWSTGGGPVVWVLSAATATALVAYLASLGRRLLAQA